MTIVSNSEFTLIVELSDSTSNKIIYNLTITILTLESLLLQIISSKFKVSGL